MAILKVLTLEGLIAVLSLRVGCFALGYAIGSHDINLAAKYPQSIVYI
jgi:hypothetical protein